MASPDFVAYLTAHPAFFVDDVGGAGGTSLNQTNLNRLSGDPGGYINDHVNGVGTTNHHGTMDLLDYDNVTNAAHPYQLLETTAYANTATNAATAVTSYKRHDMTANLFRSVFGGSASDLTTKISDWVTNTSSFNLTTAYGLLHGGAPSFGNFVVTPASGATVAIVVHGTSADPDAQGLLDVTNNAGSVHYWSVTAPNVAGSIPAINTSRGILVAIATNDTYAALQARSRLNVAQKVISLQYSNVTENGWFSSDGSGQVTTLVHTGLATFNTDTAFVEVDTSVIAGVAGKSLIAADSTSHTLKINQNNAGWIGLSGAAAASGSSGYVQYTSGSGVFAADVEHFWDHTNKRLGLGTSTPVTQLNLTGAQTFNAMALPTNSTASPDNAILAYDSVTHFLKLSQNGQNFSQILQASTTGNQNFASTGGSVTISSLSGTFIHNQFTQDTSGDIVTQGYQAGFRFYDQGGGGNSAIWYRTASSAFFYSDESGIAWLWAINTLTGGLVIGSPTVSKFSIGGDGTIASTPVLIAAANGVGASFLGGYTTQANETITAVSVGAALTSGASSTAMNLRGVTVNSFTGTVTAGATATQWIGVYVPMQAPVANLTITDAWGVFVSPSTGATNNIAAMFQGTAANPGAVGVGIVANSRPLGTLHVGQAATGTTTLLVTSLSASTSPLVSFDSSAAVTGGAIWGWDKTGHLNVAQTSNPPTFVLGVGAGTGGGSAPAGVFATGATDQAGMFQITTGTQVPTASATVVTITFKNAMNATPRAIIIVPCSSDAQILDGTAGGKVVAYFSNYSAASFVLSSGTTGLSASKVYQWAYWVL